MMEYEVAVEGQGFTLHEVTSSFDLDLAEVTYNDFDGSLPEDALENRFYNDTAAGTWPGENDFVGVIYVPISGSVIQDWIRNTNPGVPNAFFGYPTDSSDGQQLSSAEAPELSGRPRLHIQYTFESE